MSGHSVSTDQHLIRSNIWSREIKDVLTEELFAVKYVRWVKDFPDGDTLNIPSIGLAETADYTEGQAVRYNALDTGNFTLTITKYKQSAVYITEKERQDSFYASQLEGQFVPAMHRAIAKVMETDTLTLGYSGQTASALNAINGANHRWVAAGTSAVMSPKDFALAGYALFKANVPATNLTAILDPSAEYQLSTVTNLVNLISNPQWEGVVRQGMSTGMQFRFSIFGFDAYRTINVPAATTETISSGPGATTTVTTGSGVANTFFSCAANAQPFVGALRMAPKVDSEWNKDLRREEYVTTTRYGLKLFRPENMVIVLSDSSQVS